MAPYDPPNAFYTEVSIPEYINVFKLMGRGGYHLKNITERSGCQYIWVDMNRRVVEIWGKESTLAAGIKAVRHRISKLTNIWVPTEYSSLKNLDLKTRISVRSWENGYKTYYDIVGSDQDANQMFDEICKTYPYNPYMTQIMKRSPMGLLAARFSSCD